MTQLPKLTYKGLTIILSNPSRFDKLELLSGRAGWWFDNECLQPEINRFQCCITTVDDFLREGPLENTKCILALGDYALSCLNFSQTSLNQQRGSHFMWNNIPVIASFFPQDCMDPQDYESTHNPLSKNKEKFKDTEDAEDTDDFSATDKRKGATSRKNFKFWLKKDCKKAVRFLGGIPEDRKIPVYLYPEFHFICKLLRETKNSTLYLDIENDCDCNLTCIGISFGHEVYVIPYTLYNYTPAYSRLPYLLASLAVAMRDNEVVCHNTYHDLFVLACKYRIPFGRKIYDTMLAHNRCFVEVEKSLGHCVSLYTNQPYHKDDGIFMPRNHHEQERLWSYNGKDVSTMILVREAIDSYASSDTGLKDSIALANDCIYPYLLTSMLGIRYKHSEIEELVKENDNYMTQLLRIAKHLAGYPLLPSSNKQLVNYFHNELGYKVMMRSSKTNQPSLGGTIMYKLRMAYPNNSVINLVLKYREIQKLTGTLRSTPWNYLQKYHQL